MNARLHESTQVTDQTATDFLQRLVATPSLSHEESAAVDVFVDMARSLGLEAEIDEAGSGLAFRGPREDATRQIMLLGHIDTFPGEIPVRLEDGVLHGRGAVDAKGPLCAMLLAAASADVPDDVSIVVGAAVGEESANSPGACAIRDRFRPDACVIGEPSGWDGVALGYKGRLVLDASIVKEGAHSAGPEGSASDALVAMWADAVRVIEGINEGRERVIDQVQATLLSISSDADGLHDTARLGAGFRIPDWIQPHEVESTIRTVNARGCELRFDGHIPAHMTTRNDPVVRAISGAIRDQGATPRPKLKTGTADMNIVGPAWGCPIAAYGPGDSSLDHTPEERIEIAEYLRSIEVLKRAISTLAEDLATFAD